MSWFQLLRKRLSGRRPTDGWPMPGQPSVLTLVLPDELTEQEFTDGIGQALGDSRDAFADQARHTAALAGRETHDEVRRAYLTGRSHAFSEAVARTDAAVAKVFGLDGQRPGASS
ncbi:hypothetical protein [Actinomadura rubrisoli]|uniref:Uncharacterized protein n=1 Tax=Actinomadura rubrisoli TaxID=2530368 RepID=A0A4R5ACE2_9ACTN|nr:hypothetical protein [Actinomadura rubrisoli]TDD69365.1 hypothetical protein E1298_37560 [Actinomadura rubrisoli]